MDLFIIQCTDNMNLFGNPGSGKQRGEQGERRRGGEGRERGGEGRERGGEGRERGEKGERTPPFHPPETDGLGTPHTLVCEMDGLGTPHTVVCRERWPEETTYCSV